MKDRFITTIHDFIRRHQLISDGGLCVLGLSGGPDSVALLRVLTALGYRVHAAHCNFHLRGAESDRDEKFCADLCSSLGVPLHRAHFDTTAYASLHGVSIEMAARELRYGWFDSLCNDLGAEGVAVAHHRDDHVETVLLNMVRGTGPTGLTGIHPRQGRVVRPMLCVSRDDIMVWLSAHSQSYVTDSTNNEDDARRNVIRHSIVPVMRSLNPRADEKIAQLSDRVVAMLHLANMMLDQGTEAAQVAHGQWSVDALDSLPEPELAYWHILGPRGFNASQVSEMMVTHAAGKVWMSPQHVAYMHCGRLCIATREEWDNVPAAMVVPMEGTYVLSNGMKIRVTREQFIGSSKISRMPHVATLDASAIDLPITFRPWRQGDRIAPFGMTGTRLVSDYLASAHASPLDRRKQMVAVDAAGRVVWLVGLRTARQAAVVPGRTKSIIKMQLEESPANSRA